MVVVPVGAVVVVVLGLGLLDLLIVGFLVTGFGVVEVVVVVEEVVVVVVVVLIVVVVAVVLVEVVVVAMVVTEMVFIVDILGFELTFIGRVVFPSSQLIPGRGDLTPSLTISLQFGNLNTSLMLFKLEESKFDKDLCLELWL